MTCSANAQSAPRSSSGPTATCSPLIANTTANTTAAVAVALHHALSVRE